MIHATTRQLAAKIGEAPDRLPITITATIAHDNALNFDWADVLPKPKGQTFIFGNPPFLGHATRSSQQAEELRTLWGTKDISRLDYVTGWHAQALGLYEDRVGEFAYVTTNSITQGDQPPRLFGRIFDAGFIIKFAHRTFQWDSQAPGQASVHCVIVGFTGTGSRSGHNTIVVYIGYIHIGHLVFGFLNLALILHGLALSHWYRPSLTHRGRRPIRYRMCIWSSFPE